MIARAAEFNLIDLNRSVPDRFEWIVHQYPDRIAVKFGELTMSYTELNEAANRLARALVSLRGESAASVAILLEHTAAPIVALIACLKAGKICVPLDLSQPEDRLRWIIDDAQTTVIVTQRANEALARRVASSACAIINIDGLEADLDSTDLRLPLEPDRFASLFYTSGSTGHPKGVLGRQIEILHVALTNQIAYQITPDDREALLVLCSFAYCRVPIFQMLLNGGALYPYDLKREGISYLSEWIAREGITIIETVPSVFREMFASVPDASRLLESVRTVVLAGEPLTAHVAAQWQKYFRPGSVLINGLGSTEALWISWYAIEHDSTLPAGSLPSGFAAPGRRLRVIDHLGKDMPPNQAGEVVVESVYLAEGYWHRPDLTAAVFRRNSSAGHAPYYFTGDVGRLRADGCLELLGRKDYQLKIRGGLVQPAEVENALMQLVGIKQVVVMAVPSSRDAIDSTADADQRLTAYLVSDGQPQPSVNQLRSMLAKLLPTYMIPSFYVFIEAFPLNANGKIDRAALPKPDDAGERADDATRPRDDLEGQLAKIWAETLRLPSIDVHADFFDLGGDSLLAARIFAEIDRQYGKRLSPTLLLSAPTIEQLALIIRNEEAAAPPSTCVAIQPRGSKPPLFLTHGIGGGVLDYTPLTRYLGTDQPVYGLVAIGLNGSEPQLTDLHAMAMRYVQEMMTLQPRGPYFIGGYSYGGAVALEIAQQLVLAGHEVKLLAMFDYDAPQANYHRAQWTKQFFSGFIQNWPYWFGQLLRLGPHGIFARVRRKTRLAARRLRGIEQPYPDIADIMDDISNISPAQRAFMAIQSQALQAYVPRSYPGRVAVFRTRAQSLVCSFDPLMKWATLAGDRVDVRIVEGSHHNMLQEPYVRSLAVQLKNSLV